MADRAFVAERAGGVRHGPLLVGGKPEVRVLRLAGFAGHKFLPQADNQPAPVLGPAARIIDRLEGVPQDFRHLARRVGQFPAFQRGLGLACPARHGRDPAVGEPRAADDAGVVGVDAESR